MLRKGHFWASSVVGMTIDNFKINFLSSRKFCCQRIVFYLGMAFLFLIDRIKENDGKGNRNSIRYSSKFTGINDNKNPFMITQFDRFIWVCAVFHGICIFIGKCFVGIFIISSKSMKNVSLSALDVKQFLCVLLLPCSLSCIAVICARSIEWEVKAKKCALHIHM